MLQVIQETVDDLINASDDWDEINTIQGDFIEDVVDFTIYIKYFDDFLQFIQPCVESLGDDDHLYFFNSPYAKEWTKLHKNLKNNLPYYDYFTMVWGDFKSFPMDPIEAKQWLEHRTLKTSLSIQKDIDEFQAEKESSY